MAGEAVGREIETRQRWRLGRAALQLLAALLLIAGAVMVYTAVTTRGPRRAVTGAEPVPITAGAATTRDMPIWLSGIGSVQPINVVTRESPRRWSTGPRRIHRGPGSARR